MKVKVILVFFLCCISFGSSAQNGLEMLMEKGKNHLIDHENEEAKKVLQEALIQSFEAKDLKSTAIIYNNLGVAAREMGNYKDGVESYELALEVYKEIGNDTLIAESQYNLGLALKGLGINQVAIKNFNAALHLFEKIHDEKRIAMVYDALGNIYKDLENYEEAIQYHSSAMNIYERIGYKKGISRSAHNLGQVYIGLGNYRKAKEQLFRAKGIKEEMGFSTAASNAQIGTYFIKMNELDSAEFYYNLSLSARKKERNVANLATAYWHMGDLLIKRKEYKNATPLLDQAFFLADSLALNQLLIDIIGSQIDIGKIKGDQLNNKYERLASLKDGVLGELSRKEIARFEVEYGVLKKDQEIELKNNQLLIKEIENDKLELRNMFLISGVLIAAVFVFMVIYFYLKLRKRKKETEEKNELLTSSYELVDNLHTELSHRTKNYFQMFGGMLKYDQDRTTNDDVSDLLEKYSSRVEAMSQIQRYLLKEKAASKEVQLNLYLEELLANINLVLNNRDPKVKITSDFASVSCDYDKALRIGLVMNEMVSNSFEHGFNSIDLPSLDLKLEETSQQEVLLLIRDNGVGLRNLQIADDSIGISLMKMILNSVDGNLTYEKEKNMGTSVIITCPHMQ